MVKRRVYDDEKHVHFVTFSCYRRRSLLETDQARRIVIGQLGSRLSVHQGLCLGFVLMPDHVHALVWFPEIRQLSPFMNHWKDLTAHFLKKMLRTRFASDWPDSRNTEPIWQPRYYGLNLWSRRKVEEKLEYMHLNPVRGGLVEKAVDCKWSSTGGMNRDEPWECQSVGPQDWRRTMRSQSVRIRKHMAQGSVPKGTRPRGGRATLRRRDRRVGGLFGDRGHCRRIR